MFMVHIPPITTGIKYGTKWCTDVKGGVENPDSTRDEWTAKNFYTIRYGWDNSNMDGGEGTHLRWMEEKEHIMHIYTFCVKIRCIIYVSYF